MSTPSPVLSPSATSNRIFPIRSVVSVEPTPVPSRFPSDYSHASGARITPESLHNSRRPSPASSAATSGEHHSPQTHDRPRGPQRRPQRSQRPPEDSFPRTPAQLFSDLISSESNDTGSEAETGTPTGPGPGPGPGKTSAPSPPNADSLSPASSTGAPSIKNVTSSIDESMLITHRFKHVITDDGHAIITGRDGETLQRCEDEPIHIPGAVQSFGLLIALKEDADGNLLVRIVSENSMQIIGRSPPELFALESFTDILSEDQTENLLDHIDFIKDPDADVGANGPEVFPLSIKVPGERARKCFCAIHMNDANPGLIICELELQDDKVNPLAPAEDVLDHPADTLNSQPTQQEYIRSTESISKPLRILRGARKRRGEAAAMEVFNIMSQLQEQLAAAPNLDTLLKVLAGVAKEMTGFHRILIYQFDKSFNGRVVTELLDPRATKDLFHGLRFPATDIPKQARELYKVNKVRVLYDRDQETARLVCRTPDDIEVPLDMTHCYLRAMSPIHIQYLRNMAVRASMSISINAFDELWGLISCGSYGPKGMRVSFPIRKMCRLIGHAASRNIERLSYASRLQARTLINTAPTQTNPSGYIMASSDDLLRLFNADFGLLSIHDETKILGRLEQASQEALALLEYLRMRKITSVLMSQDITQDFPDLRYPPGFEHIAGMLVVPLSTGGRDFIVFFRRGQLEEVEWAGNPYEKFVREGTEGYLEPRTSFKTWRETVIGKCREWTEEEVEAAAVLCLIYGKFIDVWRQKESALKSSQLTRLLLANSAHEVRTPLNAIINYLEIALEGTLDQEIRDNLSKSHSASKSLIHVINDLLDLTNTEEGGSLIIGEPFDLKATLREATDMFSGDAKRKHLNYEVVEHPGLPHKCMGDQRRVRQAISNITANAIQHTTEGGIKIEMYVASWPEPGRVNVEVAVTDTGSGMSSQKLDQLFNELEQAQTEQSLMFADSPSDPKSNTEKSDSSQSALGLGLAVVARIIGNMNGQLRLKSEEGKGSRFVLQFPFDLPDEEGRDAPSGLSSDDNPLPVPDTPQGERTLMAKGPSRRSSTSDRLCKWDSASSQKSEADRLIEAIQKAHWLEEHNASAVSSRSMRPPLTKRRSTDYGAKSIATSPVRIRSKSLETHDRPPVEPNHHESVEIAGEQNLASSATPIKEVKGPEGPMPKMQPRHTGFISELTHSEHEASVRSETNTSDKMRVLVAEDDPVNSRIVKKRLEKLSHTVTLTVNGEECADAFCYHPEDFDVVLMDMQMPIVDGLTSTKLIRSFEKTHPGKLSARAALCGRVPIIAVSASLEEKHRQSYIDTGFDAWILKPISFNRLSELMTAIVDKDVRSKCLYQPGEWERGGWFHCEQKSAGEAVTAPSGHDPKEGVYISTLSHRKDVQRS
ncbi:uncharacterized protein EI97DRAFT_370543 [Westerdykella ornata]|uniref:Uncharacterized protein n=1 Tax=Westerdykella ornata TaxID=318751 RepID=A0A6A6JT06_WESOR|nr:uncharacterized protein EI97DRAFT_370543 [Westerdykella ornata]KAF2279740.1 hypothetical protein EI97DRAFT_370543 [Westerdykella ornata]